MLDFGADLPIFFDADEFASQVLYKPTNTVIKAIVDVGPQYSVDGNSARKIGTIVFKNTDVAMKPGDLLYFYGADWTVTTVYEQDRCVSKADVRTKEAVRL